MAILGNIRETCTRSNAQRIFLETDCTIETDVRKGSSREAPAKIESYLESWWHEEYYYSTFRACQSWSMPAIG